MKFNKQKDFMIVNRSIDSFNTIWHSDRYFLWYIRLEDHKFINRETAIELKKVGFEAQIIVEMTSIELLSTPYMPYCVNNGEITKLLSIYSIFHFASRKCNGLC